MRDHVAGSGRAAEGRFYAVGGLVVESEIAVPELAPLAGAVRTPDVRLRVGAVPDRLPGAVRVDETCQRAGGTALLDFPAGRFLIRDGRTIVMAPAPGRDLRDARLLLLGSPLGVLFHQRGLLPLHASAAAFRVGAVALAAPPGGGKSTLLAALRRHPVLCDDLCVVDEGDGGGFVARPGFPVIKLSAESAGAAGQALDPGAEAVPGTDKVLARVDGRFVDRALPLAAVVFLDWTDGPPALDRLDRFAAFESLIASVVYGTLLSPDVGRLMASVAALVRAVDAYRLARPRTLARLGATVDLVERHFG